MQLKPPAWSSRSVTRSACSSRDQDLPLGFLPADANCAGCRISSCGVGLLCGRGMCSACALLEAEPSRSLTAADIPLASIRGWPPPACGNPGFAKDALFACGYPRREEGGKVKVSGAEMTPQRIQSSRESSTPTAAADSGCSVLETST